MTLLADLYADHPLWVWLSVGALLLAVEVGTGSGWLLWPAACAGIVALVTLTGIEIGFQGEVALFSVLTIGATLLAKKFTPSWSKPEGKDINDRSGELIGLRGEATSAFSGGSGRVLVSGAEWAAELDGADTAKAGAKVKVVSVLDGAKLKARLV